MVFWEGYLSDEAMDTFAPIVVCWLYAGVHMLLPPQELYRLHTRKEEEQKNPVPILLVIKGVLLQQFVQATVAQTLFSMTSKASYTGIMVQPSIPIEVVHIIVAMLAQEGGFEARLIKD
ncbi:hypothetical protein AAC387_Pa07g0083 [Persea americana]